MTGVQTCALPISWVPIFSLLAQALAIFCMLGIPALLIGAYDEIAFRKNVLADSPLHPLLWTFDLGGRALWILDIVATTVFLLVGLSNLRVWTKPGADDKKLSEPR